MALAQRTERELVERLAWDWPLYAPTCVKIVATTGQLIAFEPKPAQLRIWQAIEAQRDAGRPVRIIVPKARKEGVSTQATSLAVQRVTTRANHNAISVAQDTETAGELLHMATVMHANLPDDPRVKPPIANRARRKEMTFGQTARAAQHRGDLGLNSRLLVDTAREFEAGRGFTYHTVHGSEVAFWPDAKRKLTALLNAVPDEPDTLVILESTSNGHNHWRTLCKQAEAGENDFALVFLPWFEEPQYTRPFLTGEQRAEFVAGIGTGPYGEEEPWLVEEFGCTPAQLHWRRWAIANRCQGDLRVFHQEYPATLDQSFLSSGSQRFSLDLVDRVRKRVDALPQAVAGTFVATAHKTRRLRFGTIDVPEKPEWTKQSDGPWRLFPWVDGEGEQRFGPRPDGQYVVGVDPAGEDVADAHERAMHAIEVIDHRTHEQMAEFFWQGDADLVAVQAYLAALYFNQAWIAIESTGGWGISMNKKVFREFGYPFTYRRKSLDSRREAQEDRLGWDTNLSTKRFMEDLMAQALREGTDGVRSRRLVGQLTTYVRDERGRSGPAPGELSDNLMAYMIALAVAQEAPLRGRRPESGGVITTTTKAVINPKLGW